MIYYHRMHFLIWHTCRFILLRFLRDRRVENARIGHSHSLCPVAHPRFSHSDNEINVHLRQIKRRIQRSYIFNEFNKAKKDTRCEDCNKNGVGRTPEFRTPNLKITKIKLLCIAVQLRWLSFHNENLFCVVLVESPLNCRPSTVFCLFCHKSTLIFNQTITIQSTFSNIRK